MLKYDADNQLSTAAQYTDNATAVTLIVYIKVSSPNAAVLVRCL